MLPPPAILAQMHGAVRAIGNPARNSDFTFVIDGYDDIYVKATQAPWVVLTPGGEVEVPLVMGQIIYIPQIPKTAFQGQVTFGETEGGVIDKALMDMLTGGKGGPHFNATVYNGYPTNATMSKRYIDCFIVCDPVDRSSENRSQALIITGTLFGHYYGEFKTGSANGPNGIISDAASAVIGSAASAIS